MLGIRVEFVQGSVKSRGNGATRKRCHVTVLMCIFQGVLEGCKGISAHFLTGIALRLEWRTLTRSSHWLHLCVCASLHF